MAFTSPIDALRWCSSVQSKLCELTWDEQLLNQAPDDCGVVYDEDNNRIFRGLRVRMGIACGKSAHLPSHVQS